MVWLGSNASELRGGGVAETPQYGEKLARNRDEALVSNFRNLVLVIFRLVSEKIQLVLYAAPSSSEG